MIQILVIALRSSSNRLYYMWLEISIGENLNAACYVEFSMVEKTSSRTN